MLSKPAAILDAASSSFSTFSPVRFKDSSRFGSDSFNLILLAKESPGTGGARDKIRLKASKKFNS